MFRPLVLSSGLVLCGLVVACAQPAQPPGASPAVVEAAAPAPAATMLWTPAPDAQARAQAIGMGGMDMSPGAPHLHVHLDVFRDGTPVWVPGGIGAGPGFMAALHTHQALGVVHVEGGTGSSPTLGQLFSLWGVPLDGATVYVGGVKSTEAASLVFVDLMQIAVVFGTPPAVIPASYAGPWQ